MPLQLVIGNRNYSSWSLRAWLALRQVGVPFDELFIPLSQPDTAEQLRRHSPSGRVPVLKDGALTVWDSIAICEYLNERFPEARLWPHEVGARAVARSVCAEMHGGFTALRTQMPMNIRLRRPKEPTPETARDIARIHAIWTGLRAAHRDQGPFLFGHFTIADAFYAPIVLRFLTYGVKTEGAAAEYVRNLLERPALQEWMDAAHKEPWSEPQYD